jgi:photosystem II stability/assembly factor-like uncharacterized protein
MRNIKWKLLLPMIGLIAFLTMGFKSGCLGVLLFVAGLNFAVGYSGDIFPEDIAWTGGKNGGVFRGGFGGTANTRVQWFPQNSGTTNDLNGACVIPPSITDTTVWIVGDSGTVIRTNDGGTNWFSQNSGTLINLNSVCCVPPTSGDTILWAVGDSGTILKTTNGGANWFPQNSGVMENLNDIYCFDADSAIAVGEFFTGLKTTDGGTSWEVVGIGLQAAGGPTSFNSVFFIDSLTGWVAGGLGSIFKTTNGGRGWMFQTSGTQERLNAIFFASPGSGVVVGNNGAIFATTDGGNNWFTDSTVAGITANLNDILIFPISEIGLVPSDSGMIEISSQPVGIEPEKEYVPKKYSLSQNYPNPFNPSTTIEFSLPQTSHVTLRVYNMVGEEVAALVNEELNVGTYTTQWNASSVASGIYFYRLQAGDFLDTKKLLLLK